MTPLPFGFTTKNIAAICNLSTPTSPRNVSPRNVLKLSLLMTSLSLSPSVFAIDQIDTNLPEVELEKITVTATRVPTLVNNTIAQTRVINSEALKKYKGQTVLDVIQSQPGINITHSGGMGTASNFYMRGYDSKSVLVLIDGMRYSSITLGTPALNLLPAEQIERIEVLYGASGSSIYGSDAMGGVIQIFTKGQKVTQNEFSVTAGFGSHDHYLYGGTANLTNNNGTTASISASRNDTNGFNAVIAGDNYHPDDDGFESTNASLALEHRLNDSLSLGVTALYADSTTEFDSYPEYDYSNYPNPPTLLAPAYENAHADQKNGAANAYINYRSDYVDSKLSFGYSIDESTTYDNALNHSEGSVFDTKQKSVRLENTLPLANFSDVNKNLGRLIFGAEYLDQSVDSTTIYDKDDRDVTSGFLGYQFADDTYSLQANYRLDNSSQYDRNSAYNLGAAFKLTPEVTVGADFSRGFRAPTFNELYWPYSGNADLNPEISDNYEAFIAYDTDTQSTRLTGFYNDIEDLIIWSAGSNYNLNKAKVKGATLTTDWYIDSWIMGASYTYQEAEDDNGGVYDGNLLRYRPENQAKAYVGFAQPKFDVRVEGQYIDDRFTSEANADKLDSYTLINVSGNYHFTPALTGSLRVDNLTDEDYTISNQFGTEYATDGTNFFASLNYTWY